MKEIIVFFVIVWVIAYYILKDNYKDYWQYFSEDNDEESNT